MAMVSPVVVDVTQAVRAVASGASSAVTDKVDLVRRKIAFQKDMRKDKTLKWLNAAHDKAQVQKHHGNDSWREKDLQLSTLRRLK